MIGIADIVGALKNIIGSTKKGLNTELPMTALTPIKLATSIELAKNSYDKPPQPIPFLILEVADPPYLAEKPVFNIRLLEKELPDIDSIEKKMSKLENRVTQLEKRVKDLEEQVSSEE